MAIPHKHLKLDQTKIDKARRVLGTQTEQETVERALELAIAEESILRVHRKVRGTLTARELGAIVVTANVADFEAIRKVETFALERV